MLKKIGLGLLAVVVILVGVIASRPDSFHVERTAQIAAPPSVVFAQIADFHKWQSWSPWEKLDPNMKKTHEGPESGVGAKYSWTGNDQVGEGRMTITESRPGEKVVIKLEFLKPWEAVNDTTFTMVPDAGGTKVTWAMDGKNNFMAKAFSMFMNMDEMVGKDFDKGLAAMRDVSETEAKKLAEEAQRAAAAAAAQAAAAQAAQPTPPAAAPSDAPKAP